VQPCMQSLLMALHRLLTQGQAVQLSIEGRE
jgi:hypothetical protein